MARCDERGPSDGRGGLADRVPRLIAGLARLLAGDGEGVPPDFDAVLDDGHIEDDMLRLVFVACHPVLSTDARVALTLRLLGGLTTGEIARASLVSESTIAQRIQ